MNLISIIVPVYNVKNYLCQCVDSIISQTYKNLEIILVDDGSTDGSSQICDDYAKKDTRIHVIHKNNGGLSDARNCGLNISKGNFIVFVDSDDYIDKYLVEKSLNASIRDNASLVIYNNCMVHDDKTIVNDCIIKSEILNNVNAIKKLHEPNNWSYVVSWSKLYKREILKNITFPKGKLHEDEYVIHEVLYNAKIITCIPETLYYYRQRDDSIMGRQADIKHLDQFDALIERYNFYMDNKLYKEAKLCIGYLFDKYFTVGPRVSCKSIKDVLYFHKTAKKIRTLYIKYCKKTKTKKIVSMVFPALYFCLARIKNKYF